MSLAAVLTALAVSVIFLPFLSATSTPPMNTSTTRTISAMIIKVIIDDTFGYGK